VSVIGLGKFRAVRGSRSSASQMPELGRARYDIVFPMAAGEDTKAIVGCSLAPAIRAAHQSVYLRE